MNITNTINVAALKTFLHDVERGYEPIIVKKPLKSASNLRKIKGIKLKLLTKNYQLLLSNLMK